MRRLLLLFIVVMVATACGPDEEKCEPICEEQGLTCGDDGCGGTCGECGDGTVCLEGNCIECDAKTNCQGQQCGPNSCGGSCGACSEDAVCDHLSYLCIDQPASCEPACEIMGYDCGPDGCGGDCGQCPAGTVCIADTHACKGQCEPDCEGKECGDDGCEGVCGTCADFEFCDDENQCSPAGLLPEDDFRVLFGYQGRIPGFNNEEHDLQLINPDRSNPLAPGTPGPQPLTGFSLGESTDGCQLILAEDEEGNATEYGPCSCNFGCVVDRSLQWIAVSIKRPTASGFTFQIGRFDAQLHVAMVKGVFMKNVVDFKFAGNYLYYSKQYLCDGAHCQYTIYRRQLEPVGMEEELFIFPPEDDKDWPQHTNYKGHFKVSADGNVVVILGTTIRSVRIYMWKAGNLHQLDYVCNHKVNEECIGAGSEYTDTDPVAISPDNSKIVAFTVAERDLRARVYDTTTLEMKYLNLYSVPTGTFMADVCQYLGQAEDWRFQKVVGNPLFSADGKSLYFLVKNECSDVIAAYSKPHTNLLMMDLAAIGDGTPFELSDFVNITKNPKNGEPGNIILESFDLSPSGKTIVLTGSPMYTFYGDPMEPIMEAMAVDAERPKKDKEIWLVGSGGQGWTQLTDDKKFAAQSPVALDSSVTEHYNNLRNPGE